MQERGGACRKEEDEDGEGEGVFVGVGVNRLTCKEFPLMQGKAEFKWFETRRAGDAVENR